jgi:hypothetical protein
MGVGGQHHARATLPLGRRPVHILQKAGQLRIKLASSRIQFLDCPAHSESLHHLHYLIPQPTQYANYAIVFTFSPVCINCSEMLVHCCKSHPVSPHVWCVKLLDGFNWILFCWANIVVLCWFIVILHQTAYFLEDDSYQSLVQDIQLRISFQCTLFIWNVFQYSVYHS